jgi:hypothetical protein
LLNLVKQWLQFFKGSAGHANSETFSRKPFGYSATRCVTSTYDQADFGCGHEITLEALT